MDLDITTRGTQLRPEWRDLIESRAERIAQRHARLMRLRVTLEGSRHHQEGAHEVRLSAALPGQILHASKAQPEMRDALHAAFEALERELAEALS